LGLSSLAMLMIGAFTMGQLCRYAR
jgi:hypothetical protein